MRMNFTLTKQHQYSFSDLENMIAWERQVNIALLMAFLKEEAERLKLERTTRR